MATERMQLPQPATASETGQNGLESAASSAGKTKRPCDEASLALRPVPKRPRPGDGETRTPSPETETELSSEAAQCQTPRPRNSPGPLSSDDAVGATPQPAASAGSQTADSDGLGMSVQSEGSVLPSNSGDDLNWDRPVGKSLTEEPLYRVMNLASNGIYLRHPCDPLPKYVVYLEQQVCRDRGDSYGVSVDEVRQLHSLAMGAAAPQVANYFYGRIFPKPRPGSLDFLRRTDRQPMAEHAVPGTGSKFPVSMPAPDMLYGYDRQAAFLSRHHLQLFEMGADMVANTEDLIYPFLVVNLYGDGPGGNGSMWATANKCLGGLASCVNLAERLNDQLNQCEADSPETVDNFVFSIAMNGIAAQLYLTWKADEQKYHMAQVKSFLFQDPKHYLEFRKMVLNILDWGRAPA